ncbi:MAG: dynamin family protein [Oscillospiraceae bacterium]|nr:dynamin family protein [Oscillospiraceae bacterium]
MRYKVANSDFFKKPAEEKSLKEKPETPLGTDENSPKMREKFEKAQPIRIRNEVNSALIDSGNILRENGFSDLASEVDKICQSANRERFTIAVVGEFNRGKSTFINELLERDFLPVGNLPTTAVMTGIRYHSKEMIVAFNENNEKITERELSQDSWDGLVAENFGGEDFRGTVLAGVNSKWLDDTNIEIIDTPGAGDLNESRIKVVSDALLGCDGAIIAVNANAALGMTEKIFIEERLLARKIPFMLMIVTKLDLVPINERADVIRYIKNKLAAWKQDIPVYIPYQIEMNDSSFDDIIGTDKIKLKIGEWITYPERVQTVEGWMLEKTSNILDYAVSALNEKKIIAEESDKDKREKMISDKKQKLTQAKLVWRDLRLQMQKRYTKCYELLLSKTDEYSANITEKLQYEAAHSANPKKWWTEDFPYRSKIELTNMAVGIDNIISGRIAEDARWYNITIEKTFDSYIICQKETVSDKEIFRNFSIGESLEFDDLDKQRNIARAGSAVLSIAGFMLFSSIGFVPIIATMGIGTGTAIISEHLFKKKIEEQKETVNKEIARCVPIFIRESLEDSEKKLEIIYNNIITEAEKSEDKWLSVQEEAIEGTNIPGEGKYAAEIAEKLSELQKQSSVIKAMIY